MSSEAAASLTGKKRKRAGVPSDAGIISAPPAGAEEPAAAVHTVYLQGLPFTASEDDIHEFFIGCGEIASVRAPRYQDTGRLMGYAHVDFVSRDGASKALRQDGKHIGERFIQVAAARPVSAGADSLLAFSSRPRPGGCTTLFVKGLPYDCDEDGVKAAMSTFGNVTSVRLGRWNDTGRLKGFGYVSYEHGYSAEAAVKAYRQGIAASSSGAGSASSAPLRVGGRMVHLDYETGAPKGSFKTSSGQSFFRTEEAAVVQKPVSAAVAAAAASAASKKGATAGASSHKAGAAAKKGRVEGEVAANAADDEDFDAPAPSAPGEKRRKKKAAETAATVDTADDRSQLSQAAAADEAPKHRSKKK